MKELLTTLAGFLLVAMCFAVGCALFGSRIEGVYTLTKPDATTQIVKRASIFQGTVRWTDLDGTEHAAASAGYQVTVSPRKEQ